MQKVLMVVIFLAGVLFGSENWNGWNDTSAVSSFRCDSIAYTLAFDIAKYEDIVVMVKADDTSEAGFASDSINFRYGLQGGTQTKDNGGNIDTSWNPVVWIDSMVLANIGTVTAGLTDGWIDTNNVTGWAYQERRVNAVTGYSWRPLMRYVFEGLSDNITGSFLKLQLQHTRRLGTHTNKD